MTVLVALQDKLFSGKTFFYHLQYQSSSRHDKAKGKKKIQSSKSSGSMERHQVLYHPHP